jgi:hypothetical protein
MDAETICEFTFFNSLAEPLMPSKGDKTENRVLQGDESFIGRRVRAESNRSWRLIPRSVVFKNQFRSKEELSAGNIQNSFCD